MSSSPSVTASPSVEELEVFFDGDCPLCVREMNLLKRWIRSGRVRFTDISAPDFPPPELGRTFDELMARMHGRLPDGTWIEGVEVFRRLYAAAGLGVFVWFSRCPGLSHLLDLAYTLFAKNRLRLTGRCEGVCRRPTT